jgi:formyltetrahydrofolate-dependent phosphoribosylglycinamide formyltransferase
LKNGEKSPKRVAVLVSGGGSNLQALIDRVNDGTLPVDIVRVISNVSNAYALERAKKNGIDTSVVSHKDYSDAQSFSQAILEELIRSEVDIICLAGFLRILTPEVPLAFPGRMLNIHPALLPAFGGKGMFGSHVHRAVLASGTQFSGATVHFVTGEPDVGPIILQKTVPVCFDDTEDTLAAKILAVEHEIYPLAVQWVAQDRLKVDGMRVHLIK